MPEKLLAMLKGSDEAAAANVAPVTASGDRPAARENPYSKLFADLPKRQPKPMTEAQTDALRRWVDEDPGSRL